MKLSRKQITRQDFVDNSIFELLQDLNPTNNELEWNIEIIGQIRDIIRSYFTDNVQNFIEQDFYPYIEE
jgi:DNA polymerase sigma